LSRGVSLAVSSSGTRGPNDWVDMLVGDGYTEFTRSREETYKGYLAPQQTVARVRGWMLDRGRSSSAIAAPTTVAMDEEEQYARRRPHRMESSLGCRFGQA
jgi:hypothetical protein